MDIGNGTLVSGQSNQVSLTFWRIVSDIQDLMATVFPNLGIQFKDQTWLRCATLAPKNVVVDDLNIKPLDQMPSELCSYKSVDSVLNFDEVVNYNTACLNSLAPPHNLHLKIGAPLMVLRNLNSSTLCSGTLLLRRLYQES